METPNVNNLNGVPNFGHGLDPETTIKVEIAEDPSRSTEGEVIPTEPEEPSVDEEEVEPNTEDTVNTHGKNKRKAK